MSDAPGVKQKAAESYKNIGYGIINDAVPVDVAKKCRDIFVEADYDYVVQDRKDHYSHVFSSTDPDLPRSDEHYIARFHRAEQVEGCQEVVDLLKTYIAHLVEEVSGVGCQDIFTLRAYKMVSGDVIRFHVDNYLSDVGFTYHLCNRWQWDWGGLLQMVRDETVLTAMPRFNQLVVVNHGLKLHHSVSMITDFSLEPRYTLVGFPGTE